MDGTSSLIGLAEDIDGAEYNDENDVGFRDWKLNACTVNPALSICSSVANKKYDEANNFVGFNNQSLYAASQVLFSVDGDTDGEKSIQLANCWNYTGNLFSYRNTSNN